MKFKSLLILCVLLLAFSGSTFAQDEWATPPDSSNAPDWWGTFVDHYYGYWNATGAPLDDTCDYTGTPCECSGLTHTVTETAVEADTEIEVYLGNCYVDANIKRVFVFITGTGATPAPGDIILDTDAGSAWLHRQVNTGGDGSNWWVRVHAYIDPQPDWETVTFTIVGGGTVTECWAGSLCREHVIPTLSEWGLIIFSLLILTLVTVVMVRRKRATVPA